MPIIAITLLAATSFGAENEEGFQSLFDGKSMGDWKVSENKETFKIEDEALVADGPRAHAFYTGDVNGGKFKDFELL